MSESRLKRELLDVKSDATSGVTATPLQEGDLKHLIGTIKGPVGSPYEGGVFRVKIDIGSEYPFAPPKMQFQTKVWHPNISSVTGAICLDILKDQWSPALTIKTTLVSLQALLSAPEPSDPQDAVVAKMYMEDRKKFNETAKFWTDTYASDKPEPSALEQLVAMGFPESKAKIALEQTKGNREAALEKLLS